jgi:hypothetical protein
MWTFETLVRAIEFAAVFASYTLALRGLANWLDAVDDLEREIGWRFYRLEQRRAGQAQLAGGLLGFVSSVTTVILSWKF